MTDDPGFRPETHSTFEPTVAEVEAYERAARSPGEHAEVVRAGLDDGCDWSCGCKSHGDPAKCIHVERYEALAALVAVAEDATRQHPETLDESAKRTIASVVRRAERAEKVVKAARSLREAKRTQPYYGNELEALWDALDAADMTSFSSDDLAGEMNDINLVRAERDAAVRVAEDATRLRQALDDTHVAAIELEAERDRLSERVAELTGALELIATTKQATSFNDEAGPDELKWEPISGYSARDIARAALAARSGWAREEDVLGLPDVQDGLNQGLRELRDRGAGPVGDSTEETPA